MATGGMRLEIHSSESFSEGAHPNKGAAAGQYPPPHGAAAGPYPPQTNNGNLGSPPAGAAGEHGADASAPPTESMDQLPGYSNIGFEAAALPPPTYNEAAASAPPTRENVQSIATISEQDARDAILQHVSENCCYGKDPALKMQFSEMVSSSAFHYTLETFGERRSTKWSSMPYSGEPIMVTGSPPGPWDIQVQAPQMFVTSTMDAEVPNTASVKPCYSCQAVGYKTCFSCMGSGRSRCINCSGSGTESYVEYGEQRYRTCTWCTGGYKICISCGGSGRVQCNKCQGRGSLRWFILLTIQWTNHLDDHIVERTATLGALIRNVSGQLAFEETYPKVFPVNHFPEEINVASNNLVSQHSSKFGFERILMQRQRVRIVPVTEVSYTYKDKNSSFHVYGNENKVFAPDYPAKCCCGCTVL
jgi:hypothetical protein